jgi:hypothetical protein
MEVWTSQIIKNDFLTGRLGIEFIITYDDSMPEFISTLSPPGKPAGAVYSPHRDL